MVSHHFFYQLVLFPRDGPWRQFHCTSCKGYFLEIHGTEFSSMACYNRVRQRQHPEAQGAGEAELIA